MANVVSQPSGVQAITNALIQVMSRWSETAPSSTSDRSCIIVENWDTTK
jgi:hypothetical protein